MRYGVRGRRSLAFIRGYSLFYPDEIAPGYSSSSFL